VRQFVARYGWRAYALPLLVVITVLALVTMGDSPGKHQASAPPAVHTPSETNTVSVPPAAGGNTTLKSDAPSANSNEKAIKAAALPSGKPFTKAGKGTFRVLKGTTKVIGKSGRLYHYDIEVENGITGVNLTKYAKLVDATLADPRSWAGHGVRLQRVDSGPVDFHVTLTSMMTVRRLCGYEIHIETSCYIPAGDTTPVNRVVIDDARWVRGDAAYIGDITAYRQYMINHEDGHAIGHQHAHHCLPGGLAPVMMQQTFSTSNNDAAQFDPDVVKADGKTCRFNPWPYPIA
jgi:hypothetical protein